MDIRQTERGDLEPLLTLYTHLHDNETPVIDGKLEKLWESILLDKNHHIIAGFVDGELVSSCVLIIVPNLTNGRRPYAFIENVVTHEAHRKKGYATKVLNYARDIAKNKNCYKIMLMTGSKEESVLRFYERAGYNKKDKTAFIQWL